MENEVMSMELDGNDIQIEQNVNNGNLNVLIIVICVCAVLGLILGIISGRRAANK